MAVPIAPGSSISLAQIQTEFGGANPISINEYYRGGAYVGSAVANSTGTLIPASGTISFISFSGASAAPAAIGWWYVRIHPDETFGNGFNDSSIMVAHMRANANTMVFSKPFGTGPPRAILQRVDNTLGITEWSLDLENILQTTTWKALSVDGADKILYLGSSGVRATLYLFNSAGVIQWASNTSPTGQSNTIYAAVKANSAVWILGRGPAANAYIGKISDTNGTTVQSRWGFGGGVGAITFAPGSLFINTQETHVWAMGGTSTGIARWHRFAVSGEYEAGSTYSINYGSIVNDGTDRTDSANGIYGRATGSTQTTNNVIKINGQATSPSIAWRRSMGVGNVIQYITSDVGGNVYVATKQSTWNVIITKINSSGTAQWSRLLRTVRSGTHEVAVVSMSATPQELVVAVKTHEMYYDTSYYRWYYSYNRESHILRIPPSGANTGTYANLVYESFSTLTLLSPAAGTLSSNASTNLNYTFATTSNGTSISANSAKNLTVTAI